VKSLVAEPRPTAPTAAGTALDALHRRFRRNLHFAYERDGIHSTVHAHNYFPMLFSDADIPARLEVTLYDPAGAVVAEHAERLESHQSRFVEVEALLPVERHGRHYGTVTFRIVPLAPLPEEKKNTNDYGSEVFMMYHDERGHHSVSHSFWGVVGNVFRTARWIRALPVGRTLETSIILQSGYWGDNTLFTRYARGTLELVNARGERRRVRLAPIPPHGSMIIDLASAVPDLDAFSGGEYLTAQVTGVNLYVKPLTLTRDRSTGDFNIHHT
jgi:hypothetical protein